MPHRIILHGDNTLDLPYEPFRRYRQVIFTKRDRDFLSNPKADRLINTIHARCLVVFGVLAEQCVKLTVLGLLARHHRIIVIKDACGYWYASEAELAFRQMDAKGAVVATTEDLLSGRAEARLEASPRPLVVDDDEPAPQPACAEASDDDETAVAHAPHRAKLGGNGRAAPARRSRLTPEASDPAEMPYQDDRLPDLRRINARHDLA